jgi:outer membrane protein
VRRISSGIIALLCLLTVASGVWAEQTATSAVTLQEAINTALANNKSIAIAQQAYVKSRGLKRETVANALPQVKAQATQSWMGPVPTVTFPGGSGGSSQTITLGSGHSTTAQIALSQLLDLNGRLSLATNILDLNSRIQNLNLARTAQQVIFDVQNAYYNVLRAQGQRDVAQASVTSAGERLKIAQAQFDAGTLPKFDVTRAEVEVANLEQTLISSTSLVDVQKAALRNVMGADPTQPIDLAPVSVNAQPLNVTVDDSMKTAIAGRPEIQAAEAGALLTKKAVSFARREALPTLAASAAYNYTAETTTFQPNSLSWVVGVNASIPIFTGGAIRARVDEARSDAATAEAALDQTKLDVSLDVKTATLNLSDSYQRIQTAGKNVGQAEEALRLSQVRYQAGISLQVEVTDAETALAQARNNMVNATYDYATALARYQRATATQPEFKTATAAAARPGATERK